MGRVHALSAAYALLSDEGWQTVSLKTLIIEELKPFLAADRTNIVAGRAARLLEPQAALALGMAIHELTTNAVKYGALSVPEGNVERDLAWSRALRRPDPVLELGEMRRPALSPRRRIGASA